MSLVELLSALAMAGLLLAAGTEWLALSMRASRELQATLELQEQTRAALDLLEREVRQAGAYGLLPARVPVEGESSLGSAESPAIATGGRCVPSLAHDLSHPVQWKIWSGGPWPLVCAAGPDGRAMPQSAVLLTRRATAALGADDEGTLWVETTPAAGRLRSGLQGVVLQSRGPGSATAPPASAMPPFPTQALLVVNAFYVSRDSTGVRNQPSLRRKQLVGGTAGPRFEDEELVPGIERLAVADVPGPGSGAGRLLLLTVSAHSLRMPEMKRQAQRMVLLRNANATPWT